MIWKDRESMRGRNMEAHQGSEEGNHEETFWRWFLKVVQSFCKGNRACVTENGRLTEEHPIDVSVIQCCVIMSRLFDVYINGVVREMKTKVSLVMTWRCKWMGKIGALWWNALLMNSTFWWNWERVVCVWKEESESECWAEQGDWKRTGSWSWNNTEGWAVDSIADNQWLYLEIFVKEDHHHYKSQTCVIRGSNNARSEVNWIPSLITNRRGKNKLALNVWQALLERLIKLSSAFHAFNGVN